MLLKKTGLIVAALALGAAAVVTGCTTFPAPGPPPTGNGCDKPAVSVTDQPASIKVGSTVRNYTWTASNRPGPKPLVLDFHALLEGVAPGVEATMTQYTPKAQAEGFVVAYPIGDGNGVNWDISNNSASLAFVDQLIAQLKSDVCIDTKRIYATGLSYGAMFTTSLMCYRSNVIAAAAPVAGLTNPWDCNPARKVPVVTFHGTSDGWLPYFLFGGNPQAWATRYGCGAETSTIVVAKDPVTMQPIHKNTWACTDTAVESYVIDGGGHAWPGSAFSTSILVFVGLTATSINATDISWDFFKRYSLP
jgi:polyhydroxybutyrate depolymerase